RLFPPAGTAPPSTPPAVVSVPAISFDVSVWSSTTRIVADMAVRSPEFADDVAQGTDARRFCTIVGCTRGACGRVIVGPRGLRQDEERDRPQVVVLHRATQHGRCVEIGQVEIEQDEMRPWRVGEGG